MGRTKESGGKNNGMSVNYAEVIEYVKKMTSENGRPSNYPFRSRFEHTMRVYRWAIKLQSKLGGDLDVIVLAALLHDIGKFYQRTTKISLLNSQEIASTPIHANGISYTYS